VEIDGTVVEQGITTTHELIGKFLLFKKQNFDQVQQCNAFWAWLHNSKNITSNTHSIVKAVATKCNLLFPGMYDESTYVV